MRLPDSFLQELKDRNNILDVVSGYVNLKWLRRRRRRYYLYPEN